jgi:UDP-N-acetylglucosamine 4,6-dehydratase
MGIDGQTILVTGGTGSFGKVFVDLLLTRHKPKKVIVLSRDELKQFEMQQKHRDAPALRFFLGDVRDPARLQRAFEDVDIVVHAAALKQVPTLEYNPLEAIKTNVLGAENVINAALDQGVKKVIGLSTDKAANPVNLYGASKLCAEKLFVAANSYSGVRDTRFSVVRYGNVVGSRGSVIPFFMQKKAGKVLPVTDERMTRFWITLEQASDFVMNTLDLMQGGEIFVPKIPSMRILELARAIAPEARIEIIGIRPGEKLHEVLLTEDESNHAVELPTMYVIEPQHPFWAMGDRKTSGKKLPDQFRYSSETNKLWLTEKELAALLQTITAGMDRRGVGAV